MAAIAGDLSGLIRARIKAAGGWLDFEEFMRIALHEPGLGYYASGQVRVGAAGDFITAPETGDLFAACLADFIIANLPPGGAVLELGPGTGRLATGILTAMAGAGIAPPPYLLLETSPGLAQAQRQALAKAGWEGHCRWLDALPQDFTGVVLANEVLDALPCRLLKRTAGNWLRQGVIVGSDGQLAWQDGDIADKPDAERLDACELPDGYLAEINRQAEALVATVCEALRHGTFLVLDYGFARDELYHPQRAAGTLMAHGRHRAMADVLADPGTRDITAHIDFTAMAEAAIQAGADVAGFTTQAAFLLDLCITAKAEALAVPDVVRRARLSQEMQTLLMPHEMGELVKMLAITCNVSEPAAGNAIK